MKFRCPDCGREFETFYNLKNHYRMHQRAGYCPICKKRFRDLIHHYSMKKDDEHQVRYALCCANKRRYNKTYKEAVGLAYETLSC